MWKFINLFCYGTPFKYHEKLDELRTFHRNIFLIKKFTLGWHLCVRYCDALYHVNLFGKLNMNILFTLSTILLLYVTFKILYFSSTVIKTVCFTHQFVPCHILFHLLYFHYLISCIESQFRLYFSIRFHNKPKIPTKSRLGIPNNKSNIRSFESV
jgi:hypothetical protein